MKFIKILGITTLSLILTGCLFKRDTMEDIDIYTTIYPINYLTNYLYGDYILSVGTGIYLRKYPIWNSLRSNDTGHR